MLNNTESLRSAMGLVSGKGIDFNKDIMKIVDGFALLNEVCAALELDNDGDSAAGQVVSKLKALQVEIKEFVKSAETRNLIPAMEKWVKEQWLPSSKAFEVARPQFLDDATTYKSGMLAGSLSELNCCL